ncbi:hypothetical protein N7539_000305 [Penicillium diatomitis]|uniref:Protein kinase domain-containing protein n=1 Tax=Penicillium diatomitis TaxID=2819901 RepID=A0A9X0C2L2_9EURO|nr:uncharacterized protein N7539_000305 [Penicillium diatomitis]KAJ5495189.1 hypothetical protein N7539_000305 [Penicillium diatomitis]
MLTELVTYGDLYSFLRKNGDRLQEDTAALIIRQVLLAVEYLHDRQIVHRDIKPDNILVTSLENGGRVVLADFGCAKRMNRGCQRMNSLVGTREYCAPELQPVREKGYSKAVDMWAIGCTAAVLLVGDVHYNQFNRSYERAGAMLEADMEALRISPRPKDFMQRLLDVDESCRMDVKQALQHEWFTHASQAGWFIEKYHDAVEDWTPHVIGESIVIDLDSCQKDSDSMCAGPVSEVDCAPSGPEEIPKLMDECPSREVPDSSWEDLSLSRPQPLNTSTTSMPQMPNLVSFPPKEEAPQIHALEVEKEVGVESDGYEFVSQVRREHVDRHRHRVERKFLYVSTFDGLSGERSAAQIESMIHTKDAIAKSTFTVAAANGLGRSSLIPREDRARADTGQGGPSASKRPFRDESDDLGQVYEEVYNPITGKRKRFAYGRNVELLDRLL